MANIWRALDTTKPYDVRYVEKTMHKSEPPVRQPADWKVILQQALTEPGVASEAYRLFHRFSLGNSLWAAIQICARGMPLGPIASFRKWQDLGRQVRKGEKGISLMMPVTVGGRKKAGSDANPTAEPGAPAAWLMGAPRPASTTEAAGSGKPRTIFVVRAHWFTLAQTDPIEGAAPTKVVTQEHDAIEFDSGRAIATLGFTREHFDATDGNKMGYSYPSRGILAVSELAADPLKTAIHEMAHCLLHNDVDVIVDGHELPRAIGEVEAESVAYLVCASIGHHDSAASMRNYIQTWLDASSASAETFTAKNAARVFNAANKILRAGTQPEAVEEPQRIAA